MRLLETEAFVILVSYAMTAIPVGGVLLFGRMSPRYHLPLGFLCRWWSRFAVPMAMAYLALIASS